MTAPATKTCPDCEGSGMVEVWDCRSRKPPHECCGGCTSWVDCPTCRGTGEVEDVEDDSADL